MCISFANFLFFISFTFVYLHCQSQTTRTQHADRMSDNMKDSPKLINVTEAGGNYSRRVKRNYDAWIKYYKPTVRKHNRSLTEYANHLLSGKLLPLYNLVLDYTGNRTEITWHKHDIIMKIRSSHANNVEQQLQDMLLQMYNDYLSKGAIRNSDRKIISKFQ